MTYPQPSVYVPSERNPDCHGGGIVALIEGVISGALLLGIGWLLLVA
jgi:hypothetical protein